MRRKKGKPKLRVKLFRLNEYDMRMRGKMVVEVTVRFRPARRVLSGFPRKRKGPLPEKGP
jgi:hypothetical protein